jgi:hypothetical protein
MCKSCFTVFTAIVAQGHIFFSAFLHKGRKNEAHEITMTPVSVCVYYDEMPESRNRGVISQVMNCKSLHDNS